MSETDKTLRALRIFAKVRADGGIIPAQEDWRLVEQQLAVIEAQLKCERAQAEDRDQSLADLADWGSTSICDALDKLDEAKGEIIKTVHLVQELRRGLRG